MLTTGTGAPVGLKTATMTVGPRGPVLLQDFVFTDEMAHFNRERIPERVVHAKGAGHSSFYFSNSINASVIWKIPCVLFIDSFYLFILYFQIIILISSNGNSILLNVIF